MPLFGYNLVQRIVSALPLLIHTAEQYCGIGASEAVFLRGVVKDNRLALPLSSSAHFGISAAIDEFVASAIHTPSMPTPKII